MKGINNNYYNDMGLEQPNSFEKKEDDQFSPEKIAERATGNLPQPQTLEDWKKENRFSEENVARAVAEGRPMKVRVKRSSGEIEDGWEVWGVAEGMARVRKQTGLKEGNLQKRVSVEDLKTWNQ